MRVKPAFVQGQRNQDYPLAVEVLFSIALNDLLVFWTQQVPQRQITFQY